MKTLVIKKRADFIKKRNFFSKAYLTKLLSCDDQCIVTDITKDGKLIHIAKSYLINYKYLLYLLNNVWAYAYIQFPMMYGRNEGDILEKLSILNQCKQENVIFYIENRFTNSPNDVNDMYKPDVVFNVVFLKHSNIENFTKIYFYGECERGNVSDFKISPHNIIEKMSYLNYTYSLLTYDKPKDMDISIRLFYEQYVRMIAPEIMEKYNIDIKDPNMISNYQKLYLLLSKLGYVKKFFQQIYPKCKKSASKVEKKITSHPRYIEYLKYFNSYKPFADKILYDVAEIDIERLVKSRVPDHLDKAWILQEFARIQKNNNFGIRI